MDGFVEEGETKWENILQLWRKYYQQMVKISINNEAQLEIILKLRYVLSAAHCGDIDWVRVGEWKVTETNEVDVQDDRVAEPVQVYIVV